MRGWPILFILLLAAVGSCRSLSPSVALPQATKLPGTYRLPVGQLVLYSDFELPANHRLVQELVMERDDIFQTLGLAPSNEPIEVYLFRDAARYQEYLTQKFPSVPPRRAFFIETDTRLAVYAHWSDRVAEDLRHELAHGYLHSVVPEIPLWLDEGLAEFFEVPRGMGGLNRPHVDLLADMTYHEKWQPNIARLEKLTDAAQLTQRDYAESWAWVYFFLNSPPERREVLTQYLAELRSRGPSEQLSVRLVQLDVAPERPMIEYLASLKQGEPAR